MRRAAAPPGADARALLAAAMAPIPAMILTMAMAIALTIVMAPRDAAAVDSVTVLGLFKDKAIVEIDGKRRLLRVGDTSPEGVTLVSASSEEAVLEVDGVQSSYGLGTESYPSFSIPAHHAVDLLRRQSPALRKRATNGRVESPIPKLPGQSVSSPQLESLTIVLNDPCLMRGQADGVLK